MILVFKSVYGNLKMSGIFLELIWLLCQLWLGWLFGFYGISTIVGHLTANFVYIHRYQTKDFEMNIKVGKVFY